MNNPYYCSAKYEVIDIIDAFNLGFCLGNAIKYILRAGRKTPDRIQDLEKAIDYIEHEIEKEKSNVHPIHNNQ